MTQSASSEEGLLDVVVPKWGMTMDSAVLTAWLKEVGEPVAIDDAVAELETDKAANDLLSQAAGTLAERLVEVGTEVEPGQIIARIRPLDAQP
jgi:pyruvate/2-oxoglutarate dehydrogenase complex dihydrolipoamide acyltransferase (E2) component